jgi:catechol-2,3-dioxygenase
MSIQIKPTENNSYLVNGIEVYQDQEGNWVSREELNMLEQKQFLNHLALLKAQKKNNSKKMLSDLEANEIDIAKWTEKIKHVKQQLHFLYTNENIDDEDKISLGKYYGGVLKEFTANRQVLINELNVLAEKVS